MLKNVIKKDQGFSLIEIVLVLAIAGLIMALVFVALSGTQKARRDTARKNDAARLLAAVEQCASNNSGSYTNCMSNAQIVTAGYFSGNAPDGSAYTIAGATALNAFTVNATACNTGTATAAVRIKQEAGADFCVDNH